MNPGARAGLIGACQVGEFTLQAGWLLLITRSAGPVRIGPVRRIGGTAAPARKTIRVESKRTAGPAAGLQPARDQDR